MKTTLSVIILFCSFVFVSAQTVAVTAKVDRRIELTSIVARLAEYNEYKRDDFKSYAADVDAYFAKHKNHAAVEYARKMRQSNGIGYDAVPSLALHLNPNLTPKFPFSETAPDKRWGKTSGEEFARKLQQFYRDTNSEAFFAAHAELYKTTEQKMQNVINKVNFAWYKNFYGEVPRGSFNLYIGLLNGGNNYGPKVVYPNGKEELYAVIGAWKMDEKGLPVFVEEEFLPTIIHEFNHSFINHLVREREKQLQPSGEKIYQPVAEKMTRLAYGTWKTMLDESLVRAAVARYLFDHGETEKAAAELVNQRNLGFLWIDELFVLLGTYENSRKSYPTFRSFLPLIEAYTIDLAKRIDDKAKYFAARQPRIVALEPFANEAPDVDPQITEITFVFDQPLAGKGASISLGSLGRAGYPVEKALNYSPDRTKFTVQVKLKPDTQYEFVVTGNSFRSADGYPLQNHVVKFKTRKE